jgi:hypothetical protein
MAQDKGLKPPFSDDELASIVGNQISQSRDFAQDFLEENRRQAWKYYLGRRGRAQDFSATTDREGYTREGGSEAVSEDVSDMVEALMATIMPIFGADVPVVFEPTGPNDEEQAAAESDTVAHILMDANNGWIIVAEAVKDALLLRNATVKVWIEDAITTERRQFKDISDADLGEFMAAVPPGIDATITSRKGGNAGVTLSKTVRTPKIAAVQQSHFLVDPNHDNIFIQDSHFIAERQFSSRSELLVMGFPKSTVDALPAFTNDTDVDSTAKNIEGISTDLQRPTFDSDQIEWYECYIQIDMTGNGRSELMQVDWSNDHFLSKQRAPRIPYATGTAWLVPHRYSGLSVYDKLQQVTDIKSRVLQQYLDNLTTNNTARTAVNENTVNIDDLLAGRPNAVVRNDGSPIEDIMPFPTNDTGQSSQSLLNYMDQVRDQRAGAALSFQQPQDQLAKANVSAASADRQMSPGEQMAAMVARTLAETLMRSIFVLLHATLRGGRLDPMMVNRSGEWSQQDPSQWIPRNRVNVKVGLSPAERNRKASSLQNTIQQQVQIFQQGGANIMVDMNGIHRALLDWSRAVDLDNAEVYWIDPESNKSQQAAQQQSEQKQAEQAAQLEAFTAEATAADANSQRDFEVDKMKIQLEYFKAILDSEVEDAKLISDAIQQATAAGAQAGGDNAGNGAGVGQAES